MNGPGDSPGEMPGFLFPRRLARDLDEPVLDAMLARQPLAPDAPEQAHTVAAMLGSLAVPAGPGPLAGEAEARSAFVGAASPASISPGRRAARRGPGRPRVRLRLLTAAVAVTTMLGGVAAAWADVLPRPMQELAHQIFGAPAASKPPPRAPASVLCTAYRRALTHGDPHARAAAHARLARAAGGTSKIGRYCKDAGRPAAGPARPGTRHGKQAGKNGRTKANGHARHHGQGKQNAHARQNAHAKQRTHGQGNGNGRGPVKSQGRHGRP